MTAHAKESARFFLLLAAGFGLAVRLHPLFQSDFPLVDGGMFYTMTRDLQAAHFSLPLFTSYNQTQIPYAYPPLGFYLAAGINSLTGVSILKALQWLPLVFNVLTVPVFYLLLRRMLDSAPRAALAVLIFVLAPNSYWWTIVGGGLTRAPGTFFFILTLFCVRQTYVTKKNPWVAASIVSGASVALAHLSWALQTVVAVLPLWYFYGRDKRSVANSFVIAVGVLLLAAPWWLTVISNHGFGVFVQAFQVNHSRLLAWTMLFALSFTGEFAPVIAVFALVGLFLQLAKRNYFFVVWALLCLLSDPRGGTYAAIFPFSVLAMSALADGIAPQLLKSNSENPEAWALSLNSGIGKLFFGFFIVLFLYNAYAVSQRLAREVLSVEQRVALTWIKQNTRAADTFLVLDEQANPLLSAFGEWFPALSERHSLTVIQGSEWLSGDEHYNAQLPRATSIRACLVRDAKCLPAQADYVVVATPNRTPLLFSLERDPGFESVYSSATVKIFKRR